MRDTVNLRIQHCVDVLTIDRPEPCESFASPQELFYVLNRRGCTLIFSHDSELEPVLVIRNKNNLFSIYHAGGVVFRKNPQHVWNMCSKMLHPNVGKRAPQTTLYAMLLMRTEK